MIEELDGLVCIGFYDPHRRFGLHRVRVLSTSLGRLHVQGEPAVLAVVEGDDTAAFQALLKDAYQVTLTPSASSPLLSPGHQALFISALRAHCVQYCAMDAEKRLHAGVPACLCPCFGSWRRRRNRGLSGRISGLRNAPSTRSAHPHQCPGAFLPCLE